MGTWPTFIWIIYRWYARAGERYVPRPADAQYPVWVSLSEDSMLQPVEGTVVLTLSVPAEALLITDMERWGYRVNQWYIPLDAEDKSATMPSWNAMASPVKGPLSTRTRGISTPCSGVRSSRAGIGSSPVRPGREIWPRPRCGNCGGSGCRRWYGDERSGYDPLDRTEPHRSGDAGAGGDSTGCAGPL